MIDEKDDKVAMFVVNNLLFFVFFQYVYIVSILFIDNGQYQKPWVGTEVVQPGQEVVQPQNIFLRFQSVNMNLEDSKYTSI